MNFFKSGWNTVLGNTEPANQPSVADTIEKLIERVETSTLLEDRRDACRALKSLAKTYRLEVGAQGIEILANVLLTDTHDNEIISYALDALCYIIAGPQDDPTDYGGMQSPKENAEDLGIQFTEIYAKKKENVTILIDILSEFEFKVRWPALKLLTGLLRNKLRYIQDLVLDKVSGIPKIMDLLQDSREIIRNDTILLLVHLTRNNSNIQKIVTFENAFDRLFDIIESEGYADGGVVVEDCLIVFQNLLKNNQSNQIIFREGNYLLKLIPFLDINDYLNWCPQKESNVQFLLYLIRTLVSPSNPATIIAPAQKSILQIGLLNKLCEMTLIKTIPEFILIETLNTIGESIRGDNFNQKYFYNINSIDDPKPILYNILDTMINEKQSFVLRCAILYCFQCFLYRNEFGQAQIIQTLLPSAQEQSENTTIGQLLCIGLFRCDKISQWFVAVALSHLLIDNKAQKELLLRVQIVNEVNDTPISLLVSCCNLLQNTIDFHPKLGLLILLCTWLSNCPKAVVQFLEMNTNVPFLISQITLIEGTDYDLLTHGMCAFLLGICIKYNDDSVSNCTKEDMIQLLEKRIGIDEFVDKINKISNHETYSSSLQRPSIKFKTFDDVLLDHEFCKLFKSIESDIIKLIKMKPSDRSNPESNFTDEQHKLIFQYKNLIREQDNQINVLRKELIDLNNKYKLLQNELNETKSIRDQFKDELALIKQTNNLTISSQDNYSVNSGNLLSYSNQAPQQQLSLTQDNYITYNNPYSYNVLSGQNLGQQPMNQYYAYHNSNNNNYVTAPVIQQINNNLDLQQSTNSIAQNINLQQQSISNYQQYDSNIYNPQQSDLHNINPQYNLDQSSLNHSPSQQQQQQHYQNQIMQNGNSISSNQQVNQSLNQPSNHSVNQDSNQTVNQCLDQSVNQFSSQQHSNQLPDQTLNMSENQFNNLQHQHQETNIPQTNIPNNENSIHDLKYNFNNSQQQYAINTNNLAQLNELSSNNLESIKDNQQSTDGDNLKTNIVQ